MAQGCVVGCCAQATPVGHRRKNSSRGNILTDAGNGGSQTEAHSTAASRHYCDKPSAIQTSRIIQPCTTQPTTRGVLERKKTVVKYFGMYFSKSTSTGRSCCSHSAVILSATCCSQIAQVVRTIYLTLLHSMAPRARNSSKSVFGRWFQPLERQ